jgi:hypothetical protein
MYTFSNKNSLLKFVGKSCCHFSLFHVHRHNSSCITGIKFADNPLQLCSNNVGIDDKRNLACSSSEISWVDLKVSVLGNKSKHRKR